DVVDPRLGVALVGPGLGALGPHVAPDVGHDRLDVGEEGDGVGVTLAPGDVAVGAGHGAAVGGTGGDPVGGPAVGAGREGLLDAEDERLGLDPHPPGDVPVVAVQGRDAPVAGDLADARAGRPG